jgi:L-threonylcarbamoyladenylate synthase
MTGSISPAVRSQIERGVGILRQGGVVAFPTETVYGLGVSIKIPQAAAGIYRIKGRAEIKALPLVLSHPEQLDEVAVGVPEVARLLGERFWPGPLTLVVNKSTLVPDTITSGGKTVAVRVSPHPIAIALVEGLGVPITGTSANRSGKRSPVTADEVRDQLGDIGELFIIDGGKCPGGIESTIIDVTGDVPVILREGAISRHVIEEVCKVA